MCDTLQASRKEENENTAETSLLNKKAQNGGRDASNRRKKLAGNCIGEGGCKGHGEE